MGFPNARAGVIWLSLVLAAVTGFSVDLPIQRKQVRFERLSLSDGLSQSTVAGIVQDNDGFMWFATSDGLNRYDGYAFTVYAHDPNDPTSLPDNEINVVYVDKRGDLWVGTERGGLCRYDREVDGFECFSQTPDSAAGISDNRVTTIFEDRVGKWLWIGTHEGGLNLLDRNTMKFKNYKHREGDPNAISGNHVLSIFEDGVGLIWVGTEGKGLNQFDPEREMFRHYRYNEDDPSSLGDDTVLSVFEDHTGALWVGTREGGLNKFDHRNETFNRFTYDPKNPNSIGSDCITVIFEDRQRNLWVGTEGGGLCRLGSDRVSFERFQYLSYDPFSISYNRILSICEDDTGILWVGTDGGGINKFSPMFERFTHYSYSGVDFESPLRNNIRAICEDENGVLWVGTAGNGLSRIDRKRQTSLVYRHNPNDSSSLSDDWILTILIDRRNRVWVGTKDGGLNRYNPDDDSFVRYQKKANPGIHSDGIYALHEDRLGGFWVGGRDGGLCLLNLEDGSFRTFAHETGNPQSLSDDWVTVIYEDRAGNMWVGTMNDGLNRFDRDSGVFKTYRRNLNNPNSLSNDRVNTLYEDQRGVLWVGTYNGLNRLDPETGHFTHYRERDGLASEVIHGVLGDNQGMLWLSTNKGLSRFDPVSVGFRNFDVFDGLQSNEFNTGSYFQNASGEMFFGGINGFNVFNPEDIGDDLSLPHVVITGLRLFDKPVPLKHQDPDSPLEKNISQLSELVLSYKDYVFAFEFVGLHYVDPMRNRYAYKLEGYDEEWRQVSSRERRASYADLDAGDYIFHVKAGNKDGVWNEEGVSLKVKLQPAPWKTWWAHSLYVVFGVGLLLLLFMLRHQARQLKKEREQVRQDRQTVNQLRQGDKIKDEFLVNIANELRKPLHGIIGLTESLIDGTAGKISREVTANLEIVASSAKTLSSLVADILDFSKLKNKQPLKLKKRRIKLAAIAEVVIGLSRPFLRNKNLVLLNSVSLDTPAVEADESRLQQILHNLIDNGIKFTEAGRIEITAVPVEQFLQVSVRDTGVGIPEENFERIFDLDQQDDKEMMPAYNGTGLGLALTRQLVELHGGRIWVESTVGEGSSFTFTLPIARDEVSQMEGEPVTRVQRTSPAPMEPVKTNDDLEPVATGPSEFNILIVDDEPINRQVLINHLSNKNYKLTQVPGGGEALKLINDPKVHFDLVLLDVMMPKISGFETCRKIRDVYPVHELPVIILTARDQVADLVKGFDVGANDYLIKPISKHELLARVKTHLRLLDITRTLEQKVSERTIELKTKNDAFLVAQKRLAVQEKMVALGTLMSGVAKEINAPVEEGFDAAREIDGKIQELKRSFESGGYDSESLAAFLTAYKETMGLLLSRLERTVELTRNINQVAGEQANEDKTSFNVLSALEKVVQRLEPELENTDLKVELIGPDDLEIYNLPGCFSQIAAGLIMNSIIHGFEPGEFGRLVFDFGEESGLLEMVYTDNGKGISAENLEKIFDPFFTTRGSEGSQGLGLHIVYNLVTRHMGGTIKCESEEGDGVLFTLTLPLGMEADEPEASV